MAAPKGERLLKLLIMLLVQRRAISKQQVREHLYPDSATEAFEKMFERDKEELRALGVPIETAPLDAYFDDEIGYRIPVDKFAIPEISLTPQEASVVGLASRTWQHATLSEATSGALRKLSAAGLDLDLAATEISPPPVSGDESGFAACWEAILARRAVEFDYVRADATTPATRHLQPWGVLRYRGRWYVVGFDTDRDAERLFRLSRIRGEVRLVGAAGAYEIPEHVDVRATARRLAPQPIAARATVLVREGSGHALRRRGTVTEDVPGPDRHTGWDRVELTAPTHGLVEEVLAHGPDALLVEPADLRAEVLRRLQGALP
jgi:proteasome accessory factor B